MRSDCLSIRQLGDDARDVVRGTCPGACHESNYHSYNLVGDLQAAGSPCRVNHKTVLTCPSLIADICATGHGTTVPLLAYIHGTVPVHRSRTPGLHRRGLHVDQKFGHLEQPNMKNFQPSTQNWSPAHGTPASPKGKTPHHLTSEVRVKKCLQPLTSLYTII